MALATAANASIVTLSAGFAGPFAFQSDGVSRVNRGLIRVGTVPDGADFGGASIAAIDAVFQEFGTATTSANGGLGNSVSNPAGTPFNGEQIYIWIFNEPTLEAATEHGLYTIMDRDDPSRGSPWVFPNHTGLGTDSVTISLAAIINEGRFIVPETSAAGNAIILGPAQEPPTNISFDGGMLIPATPGGSFLGLLSATDPNCTGCHSFTLIEGDEFPDNAHFEIVDGNQLWSISAVGDAGTEYLLRIRATDSGGLTYEGTVPLLSQPLGQLTLAHVPDGLRLTVAEGSGRTLGLEYSPDLSEDSWIELGNFSPSPDGYGTFLDRDSFRLAHPSGYYRAFARLPRP